jgi:hypothetical protein
VIELEEIKKQKNLGEEFYENIKKYDDKFRGFYVSAFVEHDVSAEVANSYDDRFRSEPFDIIRMHKSGINNDEA